MNGAYLTPKQRAQVSELTQLGFPFDASANALYETKGNLEAAKLLLVSMFGASDQALQYQHAAIVLNPNNNANNNNNNNNPNQYVPKYRSGALSGAAQLARHRRRHSRRPNGLRRLAARAPARNGSPIANSATTSNDCVRAPAPRGGVDSPAFRRATLRGAPSVCRPARPRRRLARRRRRCRRCRRRRRALCLPARRPTRAWLRTLRRRRSAAGARRATHAGCQGRRCRPRWVCRCRRRQRHLRRQRRRRRRRRPIRARASCAVWRRRSSK
jgi:hypothetical protein